MAELRAGGLAIVIKSHSQQNIGKVVELIEFYGVGQGPYKGRNDMWFITPVRSELKSQFFPVNPGEKCSCPAAFLMPIDGDDFIQEKDAEKQLQNA